MIKKKIDINKVTIILILVLGITCGVSTGLFFALTRDLPQIRALEKFKPSASTRVYSADKVLLSEIFIEKRKPVPISAIPFYLKKAIVSTEDKNFYSHSGIYVKGIIRAIVKNIIERRYAEGASTITQQLAKTLFLTRKKTLTRKAKEAILAFQLERRYTKDELLGLYLNQVYFGSGAYGIESAANIFFGKQVTELSIAECALIAGMPKSPSRYSPLINSDRATKRRNTVLYQMFSDGIINKDEYDQAKNAPLKLAQKTDYSTKAPYFVAYVKKNLESIIGETMLYKGGLNVTTTLSYKMQDTAEQSISKRLEELSKRMKRNGIPNPDPQGALISLDVRSGGILAMVGGTDFTKSPYNRAVSARRQPGSAFKPIVYAYAIENDFQQNMLLLDAPVAFKGSTKGKPWQPENFSNTYMGEITLRKALALSKNIPAVRLIDIIGVSSVSQFAHVLGIRSQLTPYLSLALGSSEVTLIELTSAYAVFPNMGTAITPFGVTHVVDSRGKIIWQAKPVKRIAMSRAGAAVMSNMLEAVVMEGTGRKALSIGRPVAGKTGTTNDYKDALFIGFSPTITTGVWVGRDKSLTLGRGETGARAALPIWIDFMKTALAVRPYQFFDIPDDVKKCRMDSDTGKILPDDSSEGAIALFKK